MLQNAKQQGEPSIYDLQVAPAQMVPYTPETGLAFTVYHIGDVLLSFELSFSHTRATQIS